MKSILSTKKLKSTQRESLREASLSIVEYDAIEVTNLDFKVPENIANAIFTSQNAVRSFIENKNAYKKGIGKCFCVGEKTKSLLEKNGHKVFKMTANSSELAHFILKEHQNDSFYFFCGSLRREEIPSTLKKAKIEIFEVKTYETTLNLVRFEQKCDGILFFSPSGVQSFTSENKIENSMAICIGSTTASEAKKHTDNIKIAQKATIESVINQVIKNL